MTVKDSTSQSAGCYWCGGTTTSVEHVPPSNLFPKGHRIDLITVPSCKKHNEELHKLDERFRFYLQARETNAVALAAFKDKTIRSLSRPERPGLAKSIAAKSHRVQAGGQKTIAMEIYPADQNLYFEKIIRGLYFHIFKTQATGRIVSFSRDFIVPGLDYDTPERMILPLLNDSTVAVRGKCSNPKVFDFRYVRVTEQHKEVFAVEMVFYEGVKVYGFITP